MCLAYTRMFDARSNTISCKNEPRCCRTENVIPQCDAQPNATITFFSPPSIMPFNFNEICYTGGLGYDSSKIYCAPSLKAVLKNVSLFRNSIMTSVCSTIQSQLVSPLSNQPTNGFRNNLLFVVVMEIHKSTFKTWSGTLPRL